jgi:hypothetical protein
MSGSVEDFSSNTPHKGSIQSLVVSAYLLMGVVPSICVASRLTTRLTNQTGKRPLQSRTPPDQGLLIVLHLKERLPIEAEGDHLYLRDTDNS